MKVKRVICAYSTVNDKLIKEIIIDNIPVTELRNILNVDNNDLEAYKVYAISKEQLSKLTYFVPELSRISLKDVELFAECFQV